MPPTAPIAEFAGCLASETSASPQRQWFIRLLLFVWSLLVACPIRYWPVKSTVDNTWVFALNYAAAHGLKMGRDVIWTMGPLAYLLCPMDIGHNLVQALAFQSAVWVVLAAIFYDVFFCAGLQVRNLAYFSIFFSLSAPLYWINYMGVENLLLAGVLALLVIARESDSAGRYIAALALIGVIPLIKLTAGMVAAGAVLGFLADRIIHRRKAGWLKELGRETVLAIGIPLAVAALGCALFLPSFHSLVQYANGSVEVSGGYSSAMSLPGDPIEFAGAAEALIGIGALLFIRNHGERRTAWFLAALFAVPLLMSLKHGFVRQDYHVINFFGFSGLALAVMALVLPLAGRQAMVVFLVLLNFCILSLEHTFSREFIPVMEEALGIRGTRLAIDSVRFDHTRRALAAETEKLSDIRTEAEIRAIIGGASVAWLSGMYSEAAVEGVNLQIYPVIQRYSAYTPYLDELDAVWIASRGPRYLVFDGKVIDARHPWAETPAMWLEVYRWYNTRWRGKSTLLLERRAEPRFKMLRTIGRGTVDLKNGVRVPASQDLVFWRVKCGFSPTGELQKLLLRVPLVAILVEEPDGHSHAFRVTPELLSAPLPGNLLPGNLSDFATLLDDSVRFHPRFQKFQFGGPGLDSYRTSCELEYLSPVL